MGKALLNRAVPRNAVVLAYPFPEPPYTLAMVWQAEPNLREWDYGLYEGHTSAEIQKDVPGWTIWTGTVPGGETIDQVAARANQAIARALAAPGDVALFAHGHILRVLTACWLGLPATDGKLFALGTASLSVLGYERETRVITQWNYVCPHAGRMP